MGGASASLYGVLSGTSMATPHVVGTVALCIFSGGCAGLTPAQIIQKIRSDAAAYMCLQIEQNGMACHARSLRHIPLDPYPSQEDPCI